MNKLVIILFILILESCVSLTGYQDAKVLNKGQAEILTTANLSTTPNFDDSSIITYPNAEIGFKYGISNKFDAGIRVNSNLNVAIDGKYQFLGDKTSKFAMATGFQFGSFGLAPGLFNFQLPLYASIHPSDRLSFYISPRHVWQFAGVNAIKSFRYYGSNLGFLIGKKFKFGFDLGYFGTKRIESDNTFLYGNIFTIGIGGKFTFGGNAKESVDEFIESKKKAQKKDLNQS